MKEPSYILLARASKKLIKGTMYGWSVRMFIRSRLIRRNACESSLTSSSTLAANSLWNALEELVRMDRALKSSGLAPELIMDHWVLCHGQASPKRRVPRDQEGFSPEGSSKPSMTPWR